MQALEHDAARFEGNRIRVAARQSTGNVVGVDKRFNAQLCKDCVSVRGLLRTVGPSEDDDARCEF